jgi:tRNA(fMet)-specific endonuclease VapC
MESLVLVDSNIFIGSLRLSRDPLLDIERTVPLENVVSCGVVKAEVLRGVKSLKLRNGLERFFGLTQNVGTSVSLWDDVWRLAWKLDRQGKVLPLQDIIIACCAMKAGAAVMTANRRFREISGIRVIAP